MYKIVIDQNPKECDKKIIIDGLIENSKKILGSDDFKEKSFSVFLKDESNIPIALQDANFKRSDCKRLR